MKIGVDSFCCYCKKPCVPWTLGLQSIAQISTNKHDSGKQSRATQAGENFAPEPVLLATPGVCHSVNTMGIDSQLARRVAVVDEFALL